MAEQLDSFDFGSTRRQVYPWHEWLNGDIWKLTHGVDFQIGPRSFRISAYNAGRHRGVVVRATIRDGAVIIQAIGPV